MTGDATSVRRATAIGVWSIGALAVAGVALAGDRLFFRGEPTTPARAMLVGLTIWLAIVWPIATAGRLARAFVVGQGAILLLVAAGTAREAVGVAGAWGAIWAIASGMAIATGRGKVSRSVGWTVLTSVILGGGAILLLRTAFAARG